MNRCHDIQGQLNDWLDDLLESAEQERVAAHLQDCPHCRSVFERHNAISEDLQTLGQLADRVTLTRREVARPQRRWQRIGRVAAAVLIVGTIGMSAVWYRRAQRTELAMHTPDKPQQTDNPIGEPIVPGTEGAAREALVRLAKGDDRLAVRLPSNNPRVHIIWFYEPVRPKVESPGNKHKDASPSSRHDELARPQLAGAVPVGKKSPLPQGAGEVVERG